MAANIRAVSVAIVVERKETGKEYPVQRPVYYISEVLIESKQRYPHWQKLVYGMFMASRKLKQYFLGHPITVVSSAPLGDIIQRDKCIFAPSWNLPTGFALTFRLCSVLPLDLPPRSPECPLTI